MRLKIRLWLFLIVAFVVLSALIGGGAQAWLVAHGYYRIEVDPGRPGGNSSSGSGWHLVSVPPGH
jgi:hypothetical protein